jgi:hypothetical protein
MCDGGISVALGGPLVGEMRCVSHETLLAMRCPIGLARDRSRGSPKCHPPESGAISAHGMSFQPAFDQELPWIMSTR